MTPARDGRPHWVVTAGPGGRRELPPPAVSLVLARQLATTPWDGVSRLFVIIHERDGRLGMHCVQTAGEAWEGRRPDDAIRHLASSWAASRPGLPQGILRGAAVLFDDQAASGPPAPGGSRPRQAGPAARARTVVAVDAGSAPYTVIERATARGPRAIIPAAGREGPVHRALRHVLAVLLAARGQQEAPGAEEPGLG